MATMEKRSGKWRVLIRRKFSKTMSRTFVLKQDADKYAREIESKIDQGILTTYDEAGKTLLRDLLERYRLEITAKKKGAEVEDYKIKFLQTLPICDNYLISITPTKIAKLRDSLNSLLNVPSNRSKRIILAPIKPITTTMEQTIIRNNVKKTRTMLIDHN